MGVNNAQAIFPAGGGRSHRQRDVRLGRERVEASAERSAAGAREGAATGGDTPGRMRETNRGGRERRLRQSDRPVRRHRR